MVKDVYPNKTGRKVIIADGSPYSSQVASCQVLGEECHYDNCQYYQVIYVFGSIKDYWPQQFHEDWSEKRDITDRLTPYNWIFIQKVAVDVNGREETVHVPRRCMHCDSPACVKLCPFGTNKKTPEGPVYIDPVLCFGGAKCRTVCPWKVPQRQAGVGIYTYLDPRLRIQ